MDPTPFLERPESRGHYFVGLGLGSIPLILFLIGFGALWVTQFSAFGVLLYVSLLLYVALLIAAIVCLSIRSVRFYGYGLLTAFLVTPVVAYIGCVAIINRPR